MHAWSTDSNGSVITNLNIDLVLPYRSSSAIDIIMCFSFTVSKLTLPWPHSAWWSPHIFLGLQTSSIPQVFIANHFYSSSIILHLHIPHLHCKHVSSSISALPCARTSMMMLLCITLGHVIFFSSCVTCNVYSTVLFVYIFVLAGLAVVMIIKTRQLYNFTQ